MRTPTPREQLDLRGAARARAPPGRAARQRGGMPFVARLCSSAHCSALPTIVAPVACAIGVASAA